MKKLCIGLSIVLGSSLQGAFSVKVVNNANNPRIQDLYVVVKGTNPKTKKQCFVKFKADGSGAVGVLEDITQKTDSTTYAVPYNQLKNNTMRLPNIISGRIYLSLNNKLIMKIVGKAPNLGIAEPSPYNKSDPNYQFFYDKIELTYTGNNTVINPTAVDFIALPISVKQNNKTYGMTKARSAIFSSIQASFNKAFNKAWQKLLEKNAQGTILRILAAGRNDNYFDKNYLNGQAYNYITDLWKYYGNHSIAIDCSELKKILPNLKSYTFTGKVVNNVFVFSNGTKSQDVKLTRPTSNQFFLASQGTFEAKNNTPKAIIVRDFTAAWSVGLLPAADDTVLSKKYFTANKANYYKVNKYLSPKGQKSGPWYNLYAKAIHEQSKNDYAWPFDDILGLDGTNSATDRYPATLTLGNMSKTRIPAAKKKPKKKEAPKKGAAKKPKKSKKK